MAKATSPPAMIEDAWGIQRCGWCGKQEDYIAYHDAEWGRPVGDDQRLFEKLCLEGFQAGLSWLTVLRKRPAFRESFAEFDFTRVARFTDADVTRLLGDARLIRHRGKIASTINNAQRALEVCEEFGSLAAFLWQFEPSRQPVRRRLREIPASTDSSKQLSQALKQRGWSFLGPTTCYAFMQAMGMVNDHLRGCASWPKIEQARRDFVRPR